MEAEDRLIGLLRDYVDGHQEDMKRINSRMTEIRTEFGEKFDDLTNRLENMEEALVEINNTLLNHQDDIEDQNTRIVNVGFTVGTVGSHIYWKIEELEKKLTNSNELSEWRSNQSCQEEDEFPKAQARYGEKTKKEIEFLVEKGKDLSFHSEKGNLDPINTTRVSIPNVFPQDQIEEGEHPKEEAVALLKEKSMADTYSSGESYKTQESKVHLDDMETQIKDCSREDDELTDPSGEEDDFEGFKNTYSCMTIRISHEETPKNPSFG